ncbi:hypothetical protein Ddye_005374 [Dipteronia dyeriana]|uniref:DDE Tnp4 domain-containing protein n=1 Tax=Dipteronia dyeriana TaxID=168575 RepID=A0AAE0CPN0_9ROSI|nr:hypothetical protein Ddye_005374 [Dipteronia dyeriana]
MDNPGDEEEIDQLICVCGRLIQVYLEKYILKTPCMTISQTGFIWLMEVLQGNESRCYKMFRMDKHVFVMLLNDLENNYKLKGSRNISSAEILGIFLYILGQGIGNRNAQEHFQRSSETDFIGAIDSVHVQASISPCDQVPYIGRKGIPTQNVMAICNFDMQFTFACAGWEGSDHDSRVFLSALCDPQSNFSKPPNGKYYLVDAGYPQMKGFLGPYNGERYHIPHFRRGEQPTGHKEIFNHVYSSLRSIIERIFGVWKIFWRILRDMPSYSYQKQVKIVIATMAIHNYIRRYAQRDRDFDESANYSSEEINEEIEVNTHEEDGPGRREMEILRKSIAQSLMSVGT